MLHTHMLETPNVLLTGGTGFIGRHLAAALSVQAGELRLAGRRLAHGPPGTTQVNADFSRDHDPDVWVERLHGIDVVVNAVGIFRESDAARFADVHGRAPIALFEACRRAGVRRIVQVSALGAHTEAPTDFLRSKALADKAALASGVPAAIVQPSIVYGPGGASAALFDTLASLPLTPLPGGGEQRLQPIHVDDLVALLCRLIRGESFRTGVVPAVGPEPVTLAQLLGALRMQMGLGSLRTVSIPGGLIESSLAIGERLPRFPWNRDAWRMLQKGNTAPAEEIHGVLGRAARPIRDFIAPGDGASVRTVAAQRWMRPLLRLSLAVVWVVTAITSLWIFPREESLALVARVGLHGDLAEAALYAGAGLDLLFGATTLLLRWRPQWLLQAALILGYTMLITVRLPEYWAHPFGPILKNLPILAILGWLYWTEGRGRRR